MKAFNRHIKKLRKWTVGFAVVSTMMLMIGCGGDDGGGSTARVGGPGGSGCQQGYCINGEDDFIVSAFGNDFGGTGQIQSQLSLDIYGQNRTNSMYGGYYQGPISFSGSFWVESNSFLFCPVYSGRYDIITEEPLGTMDSQGIFGNVRLRAEGREGEAAGHIVYIYIQSGAYNAFPQPRISLEGYDYSFGFWANTVIYRVDGTDCNQSMGTFFSY